ncbi:hypothetical protein ACIP4Y_35100 [Streptomyces sp. NPDC088810]|uniref:hypothetical protein n=1 Tax=Streptomyces sp. NPDC088810 TaxID=3365904 RepID=UPI00381F1022
MPGVLSWWKTPLLTPAGISEIEGRPPTDADVRLPVALTLRTLTACGPGFTATLATPKGPAAVREQPADALLTPLRKAG